MTDIYRFLKPVILRLMLLGKSRRPTLSDTSDDHAAIMQALRRRDRVAYAYLMSRHLEFGARFLVRPDEERTP
jgi:DNA-binding FadR family transcriptional regulator